MVSRFVTIKNEHEEEIEKEKKQIEALSENREYHSDEIDLCEQCISDSELRIKEEAIKTSKKIIDDLKSFYSEFDFFGYDYNTVISKKTPLSIIAQEQIERLMLLYKKVELWVEEK